MMGEQPTPGDEEAKEQEFTKPIVLAVEGADERFLFRALLASEGLAGRMDLYDLRGNADLPQKLTALGNMRTFRPLVDTVGVVIDAEERDPSDALASVATALERAFGCSTPPQHGQVTERDGKPGRFGAFILPDGNSPGSLEDLCLRCDAVQGDVAMDCVKAYLECLEPHVTDSTVAQRSKRRLHAYLASRPIPGLKVGEAAAKRYWHFEDPCWTPLKQFLHALGGE